MSDASRMERVFAIDVSTMDKALVVIRGIAEGNKFSPEQAVTVFEAGLLAAHALRPDLVPGYTEEQMVAIRISGSL